jgi:hypothetical protein
VEGRRLVGRCGQLVGITEDQVCAELCPDPGRALGGDLLPVAVRLPGEVVELVRLGEQRVGLGLRPGLLLCVLAPGCAVLSSEHLILLSGCRRVRGGGRCEAGGMRLWRHLLFPHLLEPSRFQPFDMRL